MDFDLEKIINTGTQLLGGGPRDSNIAYVGFILIVICNYIFSAFGLYNFGKYKEYKKKHPKNFGVIVAMTVLSTILLVLFIWSLFSNSYFSRTSPALAGTIMICTLISGVISILSFAQIKDSQHNRKDLFYTTIGTAVVFPLACIYSVRFLLSSDNFDTMGGRFN